jgi:putative endonuclease
MSYSVYILKSETTGRYYCGYTDNLIRRINQHNDPNYTGSKTTKRFRGPWSIIWHKEICTRSGAMALEKKIKKRGVKRFLETLLSR